MKQMILLHTIEEDEIKGELHSSRQNLKNLRRELFGRFDKLVNELSSLQEEILEVRLKQGMCDNRRNKNVIEFPF